jgi:hypothetical protein
LKKHVGICLKDAADSGVTSYSMTPLADTTGSLTSCTLKTMSAMFLASVTVAPGIVTVNTCREVVVLAELQGVMLTCGEKSERKRKKETKFLGFEE